MQYERMQLVMDYLLLSKTEMGRLVGVAQSFISMTVSKKNNRKIPAKMRDTLSRLFLINPLWLESGRGDMFLRTHEIPGSDRVGHIINHLDIRIPDFVRKLHLKNTYEFGELRQVDLNNYTLLNKIHHTFPVINKAYIYNGKGPIAQENNGEQSKFREQEVKHNTKSVNIYNHLPPSEHEPVSHITFEKFKDYDLGYVVDAEDMKPDIKPGDIVLGIKANPNFLIYGSAYIVVLDQLVITRIIRPGGG